MEKAKEFLKKALTAVPELYYKAQRAMQFAALKKDPEFIYLIDSSVARAKSRWKDGEVKKLDLR